MLPNKSEDVEIHEDPIARRATGENGSFSLQVIWYSKQIDKGV